MSTNTSLTLGEKLKQVRKAKGLSQENIAYAADSHTSVISRIESGQVHPPPELLAAIRKCLDIVHAPLFDHETELFIQRMQLWETMLDTNRLADARDMMPGLAAILSLPYEHNLIFGFMMQETRLLLKENKFDEAEENILLAEPLLDHASNETLITYHCNKAYLFTYKGEYKAAFKYYQRALELFGGKPPHARILEQITHVSLLLEKWHHAIQYAQHARILYEGDRTNPRGGYLTGYLATSYLATMEYGKAEVLFEKSYNEAMLTGDDLSVGIALINMAEINTKRGNFDKAKEHFDLGLKKMLPSVLSEIIPFMKNIYVMASFSMALAKTKMGKDNSDIIAAARPYANGNETLQTVLDAAQYLTKLGDPVAEKYIETVAIPHLMQCTGQEKSLRLVLCRELEAHYKKKKAKTKANNMAALIRDIYEEMFMGEG